MQEIVLQPGDSLTIKAPPVIIPNYYWAVWITNENRYLGSHEGGWLYSEADARKIADSRRFDVAERFDPTKVNKKELDDLRVENARLRKTIGSRPPIRKEDAEKVAEDNGYYMIRKHGSGTGIDSGDLWAIKRASGVYFGTLTPPHAPYLYPTPEEAEKDRLALGLGGCAVEKYRPTPPEPTPPPVKPGQVWNVHLPGNGKDVVSQIAIDRIDGPTVTYHPTSSGFNGKPHAFHNLLSSIKWLALIEEKPSERDQIVKYLHERAARMPAISFTAHTLHTLAAEIQGGSHAH